MPSLRQALAWNLVSSPFRIATGLLQTAIIARILTGDGGQAGLGVYASMTAYANTLVFVTNLGMPQIFSRVLAGYVQRLEHDEARRFLAGTILLRVVSWCVVILAGMALLWLASSFWQEIFLPLDGGWPTLLMLALWVVALDLSGYAGRALSACYEQKLQSAAIVLSQLASSAVIALAFLLPEKALFLAVAGSVLAMALRAFLCLLIFYRLTPRGSAATVATAEPAYRLWRRELRQTGLAGAEKLTQYFQTPAFVLLVLGLFAGKEATGVAFLILDLGAKVIAGVSTAIAGLVLPAMSRAKAEARLQAAYAAAVTYQTAIGGFLMAGVGAFGASVVQLLYGRSFSTNPGLVGFVLAAVLFEFMTLDLAGNVLLVQQKIQRMIGLKLASAATGFLAMYCVARQGALLQGLMLALFGTRIIFASIAPRLCDDSFGWQGQARQSGVLLGILLGAPVLAQMIAGLALSAPARLSLTLAGFLGIIAVSHGIFLRQASLFTIRSLLGNPQEQGLE